MAASFMIALSWAVQAEASSARAASANQLTGLVIQLVQPPLNIGKAHALGPEPEPTPFPMAEVICRINVLFDS